MGEKGIQRWGDFVDKMPETVGELLERVSDDFTALSELGRDRPLARTSHDDPQKIAGRMGRLTNLSSDKVSIRTPASLPDVQGCVREVVRTLIKSVVLKNPDPLIDRSSQMFDSLRLANVAGNARLDSVLKNREAGVNRLTLKRPAYLATVSTPMEMDLMLSAAEAEAERLGRSGDRTRLCHLRTVGASLTGVKEDDWGRLEEMHNGGDSLVVFTREPGGGHVDLVTGIDSKNGVVNTKILGQRNIRVLTRRMGPRTPQIIQIPSPKLARFGSGTEKEIKARRWW
ncbi:hypothetical protein KKE45_01760 [Patescibacteria group bacterium]|nr:hypothetical protein [Patescibacteria group bacterium]